MKEIKEEIKQTINLMQAVNDECVYAAMQKHLDGLLEIKRNELQQRLVERSWLDHADCMGGVVTHDQAPYKSVKLEGQVTTEAKPLTAEELKDGGWWCADVSEECRLAIIDNGVDVATNNWDDNERVQRVYKRDYFSYVARDLTAVELDALKQIHRVGNEFYWGDK